jgi:hypothetical protein
MGSQDLVYVGSIRKPIISTLVDVLKDDESEFEDVLLTIVPNNTFEKLVLKSACNDFPIFIIKIAIFQNKAV